MKNTILIIICTLLSISIFSQQDNYVVGEIFSTEEKPLDYVNVGVIGTTLGTVSDAHGKFQLYFNEKVKANDTVRFSSIGYGDQEFTVAELKSKKDLKIKMQIQSTQLQEVVVLPDFLKTKTKGSKRTKTKMNVFYSISNKPNQNLGAEIGRKFKIKKTTKLNKLRFFIAKNNFDTVRFRINVYHLKKRKPGKNILSQNIIHEVVGKKTGWLEVDLSPYQIISKKSVVVGVEWIYHSKEGKYLTLPIAMFTNGPHFYKYGSQSKWKRFATMSSAMELDVSY